MERSHTEVECPAPANTSQTSYNSRASQTTSQASQPSQTSPFLQGWGTPVSTGGRKDKDSIHSSSWELGLVRSPLFGSSQSRVWSQGKGQLPISSVVQSPVKPPVFHNYIESSDGVTGKNSMIYDPYALAPLTLPQSPLVPESQSTVLESDNIFLTSDLGSRDTELERDQSNYSTNLPITLSDTFNPLSELSGVNAKRHYTKRGRKRKLHLKEPSTSFHTEKSNEILFTKQSEESILVLSDDDYLPGRHTRSKSRKSKALPEPVKEKKRRPTYRSKSGCWTCRIRHKACPEDKPSCGQCRRLNLKCDYSTTRPFYMHDPTLQAIKLKEIRVITNFQKKLNFHRKDSDSTI